MRGIYFSQDLSHAGGIEKKIFRQIEEFENHGFTICRQINPKRNIGHLFLNLVPFFSKQYFVEKDIDWTNYDFVYLRKSAVLDKSVIDLLKEIKTVNPHMKIILEIPTYPYINEFKGIVKWDIQLKEKIWTPKLKKYIDRVITFSDDEEIFGIPCINLSNAYDFSRPINQLEKKDQSLHLLGVAALCFYHGYDRVILGMDKYYNSIGKKRDVIFTIVGDGPVLKDYEKMVTRFHLEDKVKFMGRVDFSELDEFYRNADIGIDSLARHRSGVTYNSSLKGKEYLAKGLPILSGVKTDLDGRNLPFYYRVPSDDTPIDIADLIEWYSQLVNDSTKAELSKKIFDYGKSHFSFEQTFAPVIDYLRGAKQ